MQGIKQIQNKYASFSTHQLNILIRPILIIIYVL